MANYSNDKCSGCPYRYRRHLENSTYFAMRNQPLSLEDNGSDILFIFQSPGEEEWRIGAPLQPIVKRGGTAGRRMEIWLKEIGLEREKFDITNTIQCYQGKGNDGDLELSTESIRKCSEWLREDINAKEYRWVVYFGNEAEEALNLICLDAIPDNFKKLTHPTGGLEKEKFKDTINELVSS